MSDPKKSCRGKAPTAASVTNKLSRTGSLVFPFLLANALLVVGFAACSGAGETDIGDGTVGVEPRGKVPGVDNQGGLSTTPALRRLSVDQLDATVKMVAGADLQGNNIYWHYGGTNAYDNDALGIVLGRPDYLYVTEEDPSPSSLYIKFTQDMARSVCDEMVRVDLARLPNDERTLWRFTPLVGASDDELTANVRYLTLRFLGLHLEADDAHILALKEVYQGGIDSVDSPEISETPAESEGWRAVCIALFEDPAFHLH